MGIIYKATGTVTAYFVSDEIVPERRFDTAKDVLSDAIEYHGFEDSVLIALEAVKSIDDVPPHDLGKYIWVRSENYGQDDDVTVAQAVISSTRPDQAMKKA